MPRWTGRRVQTCQWKHWELEPSELLLPLLEINIKNNILLAQALNKVLLGTCMLIPHRQDRSQFQAHANVILTFCVRGKKRSILIKKWEVRDMHDPGSSLAPTASKEASVLLLLLSFPLSICLCLKTLSKSSQVPVKGEEGRGKHNLCYPWLLPASKRFKFITQLPSLMPAKVDSTWSAKRLYAHFCGNF